MNPALLVESLLRGLQAQTITNVFLLVLAVLFVYAMILASFSRGHSFVNYAPTMLTSVGILGTFIGIIVGLLDFDINDINTSIGPLLGGLKTAFITSLVGMTLAILFKGLLTNGLLRRKKTTDIVGPVGPEEIYKELRAQRGAMHKLTRAIVGDEESTLITQIRLLRSDSRDDAKDRVRRFESFTSELWKKLDDFAEMLSKSATEQVVNALKEVIVDFNRNLTEQFGENFKELNAAVEKLVHWQENYREQLMQMNDQYAQGVQAITLVEKAVTHISEESKQIPATMGELRTILETTQHQLNELERHLEAFRDMRDRAIEAVPQIQTQMDAMVKDVSTAVKGAGEQIMASSQIANAAIVEGANQLVANTGHIREQFERTFNETHEHIQKVTEVVKSNIENLADTLVESNESLSSNIREVQFQVTDSIEVMQKRLESALEEVFAEQTKIMSSVFEAIQEEIRNSVSQTGKAINNQLEAMDEAMLKELERVIDALGKHLAAITEKFTKDYTRLTEEMARVVAMSGNFERKKDTEGD